MREDVTKEYINHWASLCESEAGDSIHESEMDDGTTIGSFVVGNIVSEMGEIGKPRASGKYYVYIRSNEGTIPHFHVFDENGRNRKERGKGFHTCVEIRRNASFKHGPYVDNLSRKMRIALNDFMSQIRSAEEYSSGVGKSNYVHTIEQWNDNNVQDKKPPKWVDPRTAQQPDYSTLIDNLE